MTKRRQRGYFSDFDLDLFRLHGSDSSDAMLHGSRSCWSASADPEVEQLDALTPSLDPDAPFALSVFDKVNNEL